MGERSIPPARIWTSRTDRLLAGLASAAPLLAGTGCELADDESGGFRVTSVEFDNDSTITLTFSEPLADFGEVDPNDFRLSFARTQTATYTEDGVTMTSAYTMYSDLVYVADDSYYNYNPDPFTFESVAMGSTASQLVLRTTEALGPAACDRLDILHMYFDEYAEYYAQYFDDFRQDAAVFIHYAGGEIPIESATGTLLADIGADWVLTDSLYMGEPTFGFTKVRPQLRLPCP